jgi:hypothetical protein
MIRMQITRRFSHYMAGEIVAVTREQGIELEAKRLARAVNMLVPTPVAAAEPIPQRQPAAIVRK